MRKTNTYFRRKTHMLGRNRSSIAHSSQRDRQEKEKKLVRSIVNKVLVSMIILVCAVVIKQVDHPLAQTLRDNVSKNLNTSTNVEDIAVFFADITYQYDSLKERAISVFSNQSKDEEAQEVQSQEVETPIKISDEYDNGNPLLTDLIFHNDVASIKEIVQPSEKADTPPKMITTLNDMPASEADQMVDYDSGEIRADWPHNVSNTLMLPFSIINPVEGPISSPFGVRINPVTKKEAFHYGIDIAVAKGTGIRSVYEGVVKEVGKSTAYGNYIVITHPYEAETFYGHCSSVSAKEGQKVKQGQIIAKVGSTGWSTGNHLHFEVRRDSFILPPDKFVKLSA